MADDKKAPKPPKEKKPARPPQWPGALSKAKILRITTATIVGLDAGANAVSNMLQLRAWENGNPPLGDRLTAQEIALLANASAEEAARHPQVLRVIDRVVRLAGRAGLAGALVIVAIPRLERRNLVPPGVSGFLGNLVDSAQATTTTDDGKIVTMPGAPAEREPDRSGTNG